MTAQTPKRGFTLIELLVVIGILAVLLAIVLIAINPARQFSQANNTKRRSDVNALLNAIHQYSADNKGNLSLMAIPQGPGATPGAEVSSSGVDIYGFLVPTYIAALPVDPLDNNGTAIATHSGSYGTKYYVVRSATDNRLTISAPDAELGEVITVTR